MKTITSSRIRRRSDSRVPSRRRRGISAFWLMITLPVLLILFCFVINVANLWMARVELENALEASALAAVLDWAESGGTSGTLDARLVGVDYGAANTIRSESTVIGTNWDSNAAADNPNENLLCDTTRADPSNGVLPNGNLIFGAVFNPANSDELVFDASAVAGCSNEQFAVRAQATVPVPLLLSRQWFSTESYCVTARVTAVYDCRTGRPKLVRIDRFLCP